MSVPPSAQQSFENIMRNLDLLEQQLRRIHFVLWGYRIVVIVLVAWIVWHDAARASPPPTVKRLRAQVVALRFQLHYSRRMNNQLTAKIHMLIDQIHQLQSDITDCVSKIPPPVGP